MAIPIPDTMPGTEILAIANIGPGSNKYRTEKSLRVFIANPNICFSFQEARERASELINVASQFLAVNIPAFSFPLNEYNQVLVWETIKRIQSSNDHVQKAVHVKAGNQIPMLKLNGKSPLGCKFIHWDIGPQPVSPTDFETDGNFTQFKAQTTGQGLFYNCLYHDDEIVMAVLIIVEESDLGKRKKLILDKLSAVCINNKFSNEEVKQLFLLLEKECVNPIDEETILKAFEIIARSRISLAHQIAKEIYKI